MPDVSFTAVEGRRVLVRRFRPEDVAEFAAYRSHAAVARYQSWDAPYTPDEGKRFVRQMMTAHPDTPGEWFQFAVALRATGQMIGDCAAMTRADDPRQCEIGFTIAPRYQGRGYATEAVRLLMGYLFARGKHRITACCDPRNTASAALLERLAIAGVVADEARLTNLAYAPEIAQVMLRRQQAEAVIAARQKIVHGAVSMVDMALKDLAQKDVVDLDNERKAAMVSNLMVVLCSESEVHPVVNTGTLYT